MDWPFLKEILNNQHRFPRYFFLAVVWCGVIWGSLGVGPVLAQASEITTVIPSVDLSGGWKSYPGDQLEWANPDFDDRTWAGTSLTNAWKTPAPGGFSWYRKELKLSPTTLGPQVAGSLGIQFGQLEYGSYQVFANGQEIGTTSPLAFPQTVPLVRPLPIRIPAQVIGSDGRLVLAIRLWQDPGYAKRSAFYAARHKPVDDQVMLGIFEVLTQQVELTRNQKLKDNLSELFLTFFFLLVGLYHFQLYAGRRQLTEYLWFGVFAIGFGINTFCNTAWALEITSPFLADVTKVFLRHLLVIAYVRFMGYLLSCPTKWWLPALEEVQLVCSAIVLLWPEVVLTQVNHWMFLSIVPIMVRFLIFTAQEAWRGHPDARTMVFGLIAVTVIETLTIARAFGLIQIPFIAPWAMAALIISMAVALTNRFNRVYTELDSLNQELESKVADRTVALAKTVAQLQEAQVQTERKVQEISQKNQELIASQQQADRIFSALAEALPGTVLDEKYRLEEKIGEGGFGVVFRGTHLSLGRAIAVKVFKPRPGNDNADAVERFKREGISVSRLTHPNIINVLDSGISTQGIAYMVMELLSGKSLDADLKTRTVTTLRHCLEVIIPVCHALAEAHRLGIIHRDIKPDNIFLNQTPEGEMIKVVDFGIAKMVGDEGEENYRKLTMTNSLIGTPVYMSPERVAAKPYDGRSDVYSVGVVLFELLTGRPPFERDLSGLVGLMLAHMNDAPPSICSLNPHIPPIIETIVLKTLEKNPDDRPTAKELAQLLIQALKGIPLAEQNIQFTRLAPESTFDTTQSRVVSDMENAATRGNSLSEQPTQIDTPEVTPS